MANEKNRRIETCPCSKKGLWIGFLSMGVLISVVLFLSFSMYASNCKWHLKNSHLIMEHHSSFKSGGRNGPRISLAKQCYIQFKKDLKHIYK